MLRKVILLLLATTPFLAFSPALADSYDALVAALCRNDWSNSIKYLDSYKKLPENQSPVRIEEINDYRVRLLRLSETLEVVPVSGCVIGKSGSPVVTSGSIRGSDPIRSLRNSRFSENQVTKPLLQKTQENIQNLPNYEYNSEAVNEARRRFGR